MTSVEAVETGICETYQDLLEDCEVAREVWKQIRAVVSAQGLRGKEIDDELRRLQANFAKSYALVRNHLHDCELCQSSGRTDSHSSDEGYDHGVSTIRLALCDVPFSCV
jgi:hypothetical protein